MYPKSFKKLIDYFASLPSIGPKMAERLVLYLFKQDKEWLEDFGQSLAKLQTNLRYCKQCFNISEGELCEICQDKSRDQKVICVVEEPLDIIAIEKTKKFKGLYHVLGGTLGITRSANTKKLKINELKQRIKN
ncbi:MAG TPA: recombination protein RecR, partial [Candidatus Moranbacteria bacterium]|nr:recombination protein RecR [Candidatus Moranbacteria bacterium]